jgi:thiol-disulfide isomerase/thioredoxin
MALAEPEFDVRLSVMAPLLGMAVLVGGCDKQSEPPAQPANVAEAVEPSLPETANAVVDISQRGEPAPTALFEAPNGSQTSLAAFKGKPLLVNLWATWCGPCVAEMPTLDKIAQDKAATLQVIVISQDMKGRALVDPWWAKRGFKMLKPYIDAPGNLGMALKSDVLPTTILYDADGKEVWRSVGGMDWTGPRANTLLAEVAG